MKNKIVVIIQLSVHVTLQELRPNRLLLEILELQLSTVPGLVWLH